MSDNSVRTAMVPVADITVDEDHNPRKHFDEAALAELAASIRDRGTVLQSLTVSETDGGGYVVIAGERRLRAAKLAGVQEVPVVVRPRESALADALAENLHRRDLDPIEEAEGFRRLAQVENLKTHKAIAKRIGKEKGASWVSARLRLLDLPEDVQVHIASGAVPVDAERELRALAQIAPRVAARACQLATDGAIRGRDLVERFGDVLLAISEMKPEPDSWVLHLTTAHRAGAHLSQLVPPGKQRDALLARVQATTDRYGYAETSDDPYLRATTEHIDAARAAGVLFEHCQKARYNDVHRVFLLDATFGIHLAELMVEAREADHAARQADRAARREDAGPDDEKARRRKEREEREAAATTARRRNGHLGQRIVSGRLATTRRERALERARALALTVLADHPSLPAQGLRLVLAELQDEEVKTLKSGKVRRKRLYSDPDQCLEFVRDRINRAKSANEVLEIMAEVFVAYNLADERELPMSRRAHHRQGQGAMHTAVNAFAADMKAAASRSRGK